LKPLHVDFFLTVPRYLGTQIDFRDGRVLFTDLGSSNGTVFKGQELKEHVATELAQGDSLILGDTELVVTYSVTTPSAPGPSSANLASPQ
jgi:pSer/pThr/pTyr-binding forkhead associated (FHA) protein